MSLTSPAAFIVWSVLSISLCIFLFYHLWSFDHFYCLRWNAGPSSGTFKRVMTYTYVTGIPLVIVFSVGMCVIKYNEGFIQDPLTAQIYPKPSIYWSEFHRSFLFPLVLCFSVSWGLEMITHLQELCFWLFLVTAGSHQQDWFSSPFFKIWVIGSCIAIVYMPLVTIFTRATDDLNEAATFLAGSLGSLILTLSFIPILWMFPSFLHNLKSEDVDMGTILRLTKFHELNIIRIIFRFLFAIPLLILGADGLRSNPIVNESMVGTDLISVVAGFGFVVSSGITLVIFFPRSIEGEISAKENKRTRAGKNLGSSMMLSRSHSHLSQTAGLDMDSRRATYMRMSMVNPFEGGQQLRNQDSFISMNKGYEDDDSGDDHVTSLPATVIRPNRRVGSAVELGGIDTLSTWNVGRHNNDPSILSGQSRLNPAIHNFTSPIDLIYHPTMGNGNTHVRSDSRLTFNAR